MKTPQPRPFWICALLWSLPLGFFLAPAVLTAQEPVLQESALHQIQTLLEEKASWTATQRKLSSQLLIEIKLQQGSLLAQAVPGLRSRIRGDRRGRTPVDIRGEVTPALLDRIAELGGTVVASVPRFDSVQAEMPLASLEILAAEKSVRSIAPSLGFVTNMTNTSEGDITHNADIARSVQGVDGTGVTIGVISDGVGSLAALQTSGDLPAGVTVLAGQAGSGSEGTAMLEIVHDLAPGAQLLFATALPSEAQMAQNILDLRAAGADIIVDDIFFFAESVFQDDVIAQAVATVTSQGALYFSSAGNSGNLNDGTSGVWEGDFVSVAPPAVLSGSDTHNFGSGDNFNTITVDSPSLFTLHWSDPLGGSSNDYDLFLLNATLTTVFDSSLNVQDGNDDPFEFISSSGFNDTNNKLVVVRKAGAAARYLHLNTNRGRLGRATDGQTAGHGAQANAFGVAAVDVSTTGNPVVSFLGGVSNPVETFSSDGPRRIFYESDGTPLTPGDFSSSGGQVFAKPDIAAADGVSTATPGFNPFFGTSAAAPHAAALAALMLEKSPALAGFGAANATAYVRSVFAATALDIESAGADRDSGHGIIMADEVVEAVTGLIFFDGFESGNVSAWSAAVP